MLATERPHSVNVGRVNYDNTAIYTERMETMLKTGLVNSCSVFTRHFHEVGCVHAQGEVAPSIKTACEDHPWSY